MRFRINRIKVPSLLKPHLHSDKWIVKVGVRDTDYYNSSTLLVTEVYSLR